MTDEFQIDYAYLDSAPAHTHGYLWDPIRSILHARKVRRVFDLGCGNGAFARWLTERGFEVVGVDPSPQAIAQSRSVDPALRLECGSAYERLHERFGQFPALVSLEVVEHVYYPRKFARCIWELVEPGGIAVISTPYHGYLKNVVLALCGKMDAHFTALWDHGHIKFWSVRTLTQLFREQEMICEQVYRVGRIPVLAKSMVLVLRKPERGIAPIQSGNAEGVGRPGSDVRE